LSDAFLSKRILLFDEYFETSFKLEGIKKHFLVISEEISGFNHKPMAHPKQMNESHSALS